MTGAHMAPAALHRPQGASQQPHSYPQSSQTPSAGLSSPLLGEGPPVKRGKCRAAAGGRPPLLSLLSALGAPLSAKLLLTGSVPGWNSKGPLREPGGAFLPVPTLPAPSPPFPVPALPSAWSGGTFCDTARSGVLDVESKALVPFSVTKHS